MKITHNKKITASTEWDNGWSKRKDASTDGTEYVFSCPKATAYVTEADEGAHAEIHFRVDQIKLEKDFSGHDACDQAMTWAEKRIFSKDVLASTNVCAHKTVDVTKDDLSWIKGLYWFSDWHDFTVTSVDPARLTCEITEEWLSEDTGRECKQTGVYRINTDKETGELYFKNKKYLEYAEYGKFYANSAMNYLERVPEEFNELDFVDDYDYIGEDIGTEDDYTPSATRGDYSPSNPWDAPGMSIHDFI